MGLSSVVYNSNISSLAFLLISKSEKVATRIQVTSYNYPTCFYKNQAHTLKAIRIFSHVMRQITIKYIGTTKILVVD